MITEQLKRSEYRFCLVQSKTKKPFEKEWQKGRCFDDPKLLEHLKNGGNYGVIGGHGKLRILDIDNRELAIKVMEQLRTFTIKTPGGGYHFYFLSDYDKNHVLIDDKGELRANNYMVVGPGCYAEDLKKGHKGSYNIARDTAINTLSTEQILKVIKPYMREESVSTTKTTKRDTTRSARDFREVMKLIILGKNKDEIFKEMQAFAKWSESTDKYREHQYKNAQIYVDKQQEAKVEHKVEVASEAFIRLSQAKKFVETQPLFYDKSGMWWIWNFDKFCYELTDEIDLLNGICKAMNLDTTNSKIKTEIINGLKQIGRQSIPKDAEKTWVQFKNKVIDISNGNVFDATSNYFITNPIPWDMGDSENTPTMDNLFKEWVGEKYVKKLYEIIAYCCLRDYPIHLIFCLIGAGRNGKSRFLALLTKFIGKRNVFITKLDT